MPRTRKTTPAADHAAASAGRPLYEVNPEPRLVAAMKQAFGYFTPSGLAWWRVERQLKDISHETNPAGHDDFCRQFNSMAADDVIEFLVEHGLIERPRTTQSKREELDAFRLRLARRLAEQKRIDLADAVGEVDAMKPKHLADALSMEFDFEVCTKTLTRWRKARADEVRAARKAASGGPRQAGATAAAPRDRKHDQADALANGIKARSRIDGITRLSRGDDAEEDAKTLAAEREGTRLLRMHEEKRCQCGDDATRFWQGKPKCDDCYAELEAAASPVSAE